MRAQLPSHGALRLTHRALAFLLWLLGGTALAQDAEELELDHTLSMDFQTPHVTWAKPYARGTLRVLFFCNGRGTVPREAVELMQRFDFAVDAVFWRRIVDTPKEGWHGGDLGLQRMLRLAEKPYDCTVFFGIRPDQLTAEMQFKCLRHVVEGGKGVVLVGVHDGRILKRERRIADLDRFIGPAKPLGAYRVGKGRGVRLPKLPEIPYDFDWLSDYEAWQERFGRAILWAAGRQPDGSMSLSGLPPTIAQAGLVKHGLKLHIKDAPKMTYDVGASVRLRNGERVPLRTLKGQGRSVTLDLGHLPMVRAGRHHVDVFVRSRRGMENWLSVPVEVTTQNPIELELDRGWGEVGGRIRGKVALPKERGEDGVYAVRIVDRRGRVLVQKELPGDGPDTVAFDLPVEPWMPMLVRVEAVAGLRGGPERSISGGFFNVVKRHRDQFNFLMWDTPKGPTAPWAIASLRRLGVTLTLGHGNPDRALAAYGIAWVPYTTRILEKHDKQGVMRPHCWNDQPAVQDYVSQLADKHRPSRQHGVFVYSLGDENDVRGSCTSPHCLAAYRRYLAEVYGDIQALNESWGSDYKSFDAVQLLQPDDNEAAEAKRQGNAPRWYDRQAFRSWNYVQYCKAFAAAYKKLDPQALTGFEGAGRFERGDDLDLFVRELGFWSPYPGTADEVLRSIAPPGFPHGNWMGYRKDAPPLIAKYWRMITRGYPSVWWWRWDCIGRFHGFLAPHLGPWPATRELVEDTQIVRDGLGTLLMHSAMQDSGVALLFSHPSVYATQVDHGTTYGSTNANHVAWHRGIRDLGLNFTYVTDRQLRRGEFRPERFAVLILAQAEALGTKEADVIRQFVHRGGHLVADVRPAIRTGHCKPRQAGLLDDLFGIRRTGTGPARKAPATLEMEGLTVTVENALCDPGVALDGAEAHGRAGDVPLMITRDVGDGSTLLLNFPLSSYPRLDLADTPEDAAQLFLRLAASAGLQPPVRTLAQGRRARNLETVHWRNGALQLIALFRHTGEDEDVTVRLPRPMHVRDLRFRRSFAAVAECPTRVLGGRPTFLVLAPRPLARLQATLSDERVAPGARPTLRLVVPEAQGLHAVRVRATAPGGRPAEWLHQVVLVGKDVREVPLPIALNDPPGAWTVQAIDLFTEEPLVLTLQVAR